MSPKKGSNHVALLRGINVGGKNKLPMKDLVPVFAELGCANVRTYVQSGNVVFEAPARVVARAPESIAASIRERFGLEVPVVVRSSSEIAAVVRENPFLRAGGGAGEDQLHVLFLAERPAADAIESLDPARSPPDAFVVSGREVYLRLPNGMGRTKLTNAWFDSKLRTISTARNWRTVLAIDGLLRA